MSARLADSDVQGAGLANPGATGQQPAYRFRLAGILTSGVTASCERSSIYACRKFLLTSFS
jgi:hypothetical protein